jgi:hypothetical protein
VDEQRLDVLWAKYVGSRKLSLADELRMLRVAQKENVLLWKDLYALFYTTKFWRSFRYKVMKRDKMRCVQCGSERFLQVDHVRYPEFIGKEKMSELQTLCVICHEKKTERFSLLANGVGERLKVAVGEYQQLHAVMRKT